MKSDVLEVVAQYESPTTEFYALHTEAPVAGSGTKTPTLDDESMEWDD